jgi:hypothetical protein
VPLDPLEITGGIAIGTGLGGAISDTVEPRLRQFKYDQSSKYPHIPPSAGTLAAGVAQGQVDPKQAAIWALMHGFDGPAFNTLIDIANVGPGSAYAFELWRRGQIDEAGFRRAVKRLGLEQEWIDDLVQIKQTLLTAEQLAVMIQRNVVDGGSILPNQPPTGNADVPPMPQVNIDPVTEAAGMGIDLERLSAMARIIGLPASPDLAARMHFRNIINEESFNLAIKEGNTRGEWAPYLLNGFREIPTAEQYVEAHLRGWITQAAMYAGTAKHGMSQPDTDLEFQIHRRPLTPHAIKQALARGANFNPEAGELTNPYEASVHQNSLGPEWYELAISLAGSYPSVFVTNRLVTDGTITPEDGQSWRQKAGDADEVVKALYASWKRGAAGGASTNPHVTKAQSHVWTVVQSSYEKDRTDDAQATAALTKLGVTAGAIPEILSLWQVSRAIVRAGLTAAQIKKAYGEATFTQPEAVARLVELGWAAADAGVYLGE